MVNLNKLEAYLVELLQNKIQYENRTVPLLKQFTEEQTLPIMTLDVSLAHNTEYVKREVGNGEDNMVFYRNGNIQINLWCDTEEQRESVSAQIMKRFYEEQAKMLGGNPSLTTKHDLVWDTINIEPPFQLDEHERHPPLLRSVFRCEAMYRDKYKVSDSVVREVTVDIEDDDEEITINYEMED